MTSIKLNINTNGNIYFNENQSLIEDMKLRYPRLEFNPTLSLGEYTGIQNQLHSLSFEYPLGTHDVVDIIHSEYIQNRVIDTLYDYLDLISERMHQNGIDKAIANILSVESQNIVNSLTLQRNMVLRLRAVFINSTSDEG